jgi:hypothetical protein
MRKLYSRPTADIVIYDNLDVVQLSGIDTKKSGFDLTRLSGGKVVSYDNLRS